MLLRLKMFSVQLVLCAAGIFCLSTPALVSADRHGRKAVDDNGIGTLNFVSVDIQPKLNCAKLQNMIAEQIMAKPSRLCGPYTGNGDPVAGFSKCVMLRVGANEAPRFFVGTPSLPSDLGGLLVYQHRSPDDTMAEMDALGVTGPHLIRRWGVCDLNSTSAVTFHHTQAFVSDLLPIKPSPHGQSVAGLANALDYLNPTVDPDMCKRLRVAYSLVDSVREMDEHGLRYYDWKLEQWSFTSTGRLVLVDVAGAREPNFRISVQVPISNITGGVASYEQIVMEKNIVRFFFGKNQRHASELRAAMARARALARRSGVTPLPITTHISRAKFAQHVLLAAQRLAISHQPRLLAAHASLSKTDLAILTRAEAMFGQIQDGLAEETMLPKRAPSIPVYNAIRELLMRSCGGIDIVDRDLRPVNS